MEVRKKNIFWTILTLLFMLGVSYYFLNRDMWGHSFILSSHLDYATDELWFKDGAYEKATYHAKEASLIYDNRPDWFNSYKKFDYFDAVKKKGIFFCPIKDAVRKLTFTSTPKGKDMVIVYGFSDGINNNLLASGAVFKVILGDEILVEEKVPPLPGYNKVRISLKDKKINPSGNFLPPLLFEVSLEGENQGWTHFYVDGYIQ